MTDSDKVCEGYFDEEVLSRFKAAVEELLKSPRTPRSNVTGLTEPHQRADNKRRSQPNV